MIWFKSCPRCQTGDLMLAHDSDGAALRCFQCGYMKYVGRLVAERIRPSRDEAVAGPMPSARAS